VAVRTSTSPAGLLASRLNLSVSLLGPVLCAALMAATAWAVLAGGWVNGGGGAVVVAVTAVIEAALLASARVPRWVVLLLAPVLAAAAIVPATVAAMPFELNSSVAHTAYRYFGALIGGLGSSNDWEFTVGLCGVLWVCGYWLGWTALREHRGILAVLPLYAVLATNVLNTKAPDAVGLPLTIAASLSMLVVATAHLSAMQARWSRQRLLSLPGTGSRFALSVGRTTVLLTLLAVLIPPLSTIDISGRLFSGAGGSHGSGNSSSNSSSPPPGGAGTVGFNPATLPGGPLSVKSRTVLQYTTDSGSPVYLRVVNDVHFTNGNWFPQRLSGPASVTNGVDAVPFAAGALPRDRNTSHGGIGSAVQPVHLTIQMQPEATFNTDYAAFAGEPDAMALPGFAIGGLSASADSLITVDAVQTERHLTPSTVIHTTGLVPTATAAQLRAAGTDYPEFLGGYTQLNDDGSHGAADIQDLARQWTAGTANPYDAAVAIEAHLRDPRNFTYTLKPPPVPSEQWAIVYFLQTSHKGYCQYFASTMGAMLRSLDIPARLVAGYGPGSATTRPGRQGRIYTVSSSDAHSWVEAYFPGYGWVPFEPTPPSQVGNYQPFGRGANAAAGGGSTVTPPQSDTTLPGFAVPFEPSVTVPGSAPAGRPAALLGLEIGAAVIVLVAIALLVWLLVPRSLRGTWRRTEAVGSFLRMGRHSAETHHEYAMRLAALRPASADALAEIATVSGRAEFSELGVDPAERRHAIRRWRRLLFSLVRAWRPGTTLRLRRAHS